MFEPDEWNEFNVSANRINLKRQVGYVVTTQSLIFVPDSAKGVTINGVYYQRLDPPAPVEIDGP
jgi:hypothetical protein